MDEFIDRFVRPDNGTAKIEELDAMAKETNRSLSNMAKAIRLMRDHFGTCTPQERAHFAKYLFNNALFIYVSTEDVEDAFRLFTILNDRGIPLSNADILKARNLGAVDDQNERREVKIGDEELLIMKESDILGIVD